MTSVRNASFYQITTNPNGLQLKNGPLVKDTTKELSGRYYLNASWTLITGWNYLPAGNIALANDVPPSINAIVSNANSASQITFNSTNGRLYYPKAGKVRLNVFTTSSVATTTSVAYEIRLCVFSSPAWPAANQVAKTYGANAQAASSVNGGANALSGTPAAVLQQAILVTSGIESGISWSGDVAAGTEIMILIYASSTSIAFNSGGIFFDTGYNHVLN